MDEPSVLDLLKEKLSFRRLWQKGEPPPPQDDAAPSDKKPAEPALIGRLPWKSLVAVLLAVIGQAALDPVQNNFSLGLILYLAAAGLLLLSVLQGEWQVLERKEEAAPQLIPQTVRRLPFIFFLVTLFLAFVAMSNNRFTSFNVFLWVACIISGIVAFWLPEKEWRAADWRQRIGEFLRKPQLNIRLNAWNLLVLAAFLLAAFFHLHHLDLLPYDMTSDHTEKLLDINRVLNGETDIFFATNGGREPMQFYLAAFLIKFFGAGMNFLTLKLTMALMFLWSLIYVYKLGKEIGSKWTGLFFLLFTGFAAWPNIIAHAGMRLVLTPVFAAPTLFYFFRGLRRSSRNDFILAGIFLGLGMLGYTASRIVPLVLVVGLLIYLLYHRFDKPSRSAGAAFLLTVLFAVVVFMPLIRYGLESPQAFLGRSLSRFTASEVPLPENLVLVFLSNTWKALIMPFWKSGTAWVISVPNAPALDSISAVFYLFGLILTVVRAFRYRNWKDTFLLVSIPLLMLPSILALAFPIENPSQSRAGGAIVPIFLITAIAFESLMRLLWQRARSNSNKALVLALALVLILISAQGNYHLALEEYPQGYALSSWNTREMGEVVSDFTDSFGSVDNVWVIAKAYWVDTRLVAINAGYVGRDFQLWPDNLETTLDNEGSKLFLLKADDVDAMTRLRTLYPQGFVTYHTSENPDHDFIAYLAISPEAAP
jgi:hypothetical protein